MTLLSVAVSRRDVAILVDASGGPVPCGKVSYIAPHGVVLARSGDAGHIVVHDYLRRMLELGMLPQDVTAPAIPGALRTLHAEHMKPGHHARFVLAQVCDGLPVVVELDSRRDYVPWMVPPGAWIWLFHPPTAPSGDAPTPGPAFPVEPPPAPPAPPRFAACVANLVVNAREALRDHPDKVAGPFTWCRLSDLGVTFECAAIEDLPEELFQ